MMVGDGANDSMALRAAHVGISLSQVEASVAAPFTSLTPDITCVPKVMCEGRGALTTSFCLFQFMCCYSTIQFANALLIVFVGSFLSNNEYLYQDLWTVFVLSLTCACGRGPRQGRADALARHTAAPGRRQ
jgi:P-type E1-E2 ATPase